MSNEINVIIKQPCKAPEVKIIDNTLKAFREIVGGDIELCMPTGISEIGCYVNESGKLIGLCPNLLIFDARGRWLDTIVGNALFFGIDGDTEVSLSDSQINEVLGWINAHALAVTN